MANKERIGFVGAGLMGHGMAANTASSHLSTGETHHP